MRKLSEVPFGELQTTENWLISATGLKGTIACIGITVSGVGFKTYLGIDWENGSTSNGVLFPDECDKVTTIDNGQDGRVMKELIPDQQWMVPNQRRLDELVCDRKEHHIYKRPEVLVKVMYDGKLVEAANNQPSYPVLVSEEVKYFGGEFGYIEVTLHCSNLAGALAHIGN